MTTFNAQAVVRRTKSQGPLSLSAATPNAARIAEATARAATAYLSLPSYRLSQNLAAPRERTLQEKLFDALAACKITTRQFAMLFDRDWHTRLFRQLDLLLDAEEWDPSDEPVTKDSFATLLRLLMILRNKRRPGLGIANGGNILASWSIDGRDRLTVECLPNDRVRWIVTRPIDEENESATGQTSLDRLLGNLQPYNPDHWFAHEGPKPT